MGKLLIYECDNNRGGRSKKLGNLLPSSSLFLLHFKNYSDYITPEFKVSNIKNRRDTRSQMTEHFSARFSKDNIVFIKEESRKCGMYCNAYLEFIINKYI